LEDANQPARRGAEAYNPKMDRKAPIHESEVSAVAPFVVGAGWFGGVGSDGLVMTPAEAVTDRHTAATAARSKLFIGSVPLSV
jgi:hypothetical protein